MKLSDQACRRPIYGVGKRIKRGALRKMGLWSREHYDVEVVIEKGYPAYKKITFKQEDHARIVSDNLRRYGHTRHLPHFRHREANALWVDFIDGTPCDRIEDEMMPEIARCFGHFAQRDSRHESVSATPFWPQHLRNLSFLSNNGVIDARLHHELKIKSKLIRPATLRIGFDYRDPIGPNLVHRDGCGSICAIDVKNLHQNTLVGEGLAKASDRWLCRDRRAFVFRHLRQLGLGDIEHGFEFISLYERAGRVARKVERDLKLHRRVRRRRSKHKQLIALLD